MESSATLMIISGNKKITHFMQCADVFEKSKVLGTVKYMTVKYNKNEKASLKRASKLIEATRKALEQVGDEIVSFVHVVEITNGNKITKNTGEISPYINKEVRCISDGKSWFVLSKFIEQKTELKVITNEHMFITGVGIKDDLNEIKLKIK